MRSVLDTGTGEAIQQIDYLFKECEILFLGDDNLFDETLNSVKASISDCKSDRPEYENIFTRLKSSTGDATLQEFYRNPGAVIAFLVLINRLPKLKTDKWKRRKLELIHYDTLMCI